MVWTVNNMQIGREYWLIFSWFNTEHHSLPLELLWIYRRLFWTMKQSCWQIAGIFQYPIGTFYPNLKFTPNYSIIKEIPFMFSSGNLLWTTFYTKPVEKNHIWAIYSSCPNIWKIQNVPWRWGSFESDGIISVLATDWMDHSPFETLWCTVQGDAGYIIKVCRPSNVRIDVRLSRLSA